MLAVRRNSCGAKRIMCLLMPIYLMAAASLSTESAYAQDAVELIGHTLTGASPSGDEWAAYYAPDGTLYSLNGSTGERFVDSYTVRSGQLCYPSEGRCWDVIVAGDQVTVTSEERGSATSWTMQAGDSLGLVEGASGICPHTHDSSKCI